MKIGFVSIVGERGQWHVTKNFMRALQDEHELFLIARPFGVRDGTFLGNIDDYGIKTHAKYSPTYNLSPDIISRWIDENKLDVVFYNEELNWTLVEAAVNKNVKTVTYLDYFAASDMTRFKTLYSKVIVCAKHAYYEFKKAGAENLAFVDWGVDTELFKPTPDEKKATFFHSAGWGGVNWRKCSPDVVKIFDELRSEGHDFTMVFHSQTKKHYYDQDAQAAIDRRIADGTLEAHWGSIPHPGLYHKGFTNVAPSKLEGLGLFLYEGLSCGMPTITTDAAPMNQAVENDKNGILIPTTGSHYRKDPYFFPEYDIDIKALKNAMVSIGSDPKRASEMAAEARRGILERHSYDIFAQTVRSIFNSL